MDSRSEVISRMLTTPILPEPEGPVSEEEKERRRKKAEEYFASRDKTFLIKTVQAAKGTEIPEDDANRRRDREKFSRMFPSGLGQGT